MSDKLTRRDFFRLAGLSAAAVGLSNQLFIKPNHLKTMDLNSIYSRGSTILPTQENFKTGVNNSLLLPSTQDERPNILYFQIDNLGIGELGCYGGGILRGADTKRIDQFAAEGMKLLNFAPEAQCTPSRSALMTGRYSVRSGNQKVPFAGEDAGLVVWERTLGDVLSDNGYTSACFGKWHIGSSDGRWPTNHGFDEWYGPIRSYDECLWTTRSEYDPQRDIHSPVLEGTKGQDVKTVIDILTPEVRRDIDLEYLKRADSFMRKSVEKDTPFFVYFNHSMMHMPTIPREEFKGLSENGDWADSLFELDHDFGVLLDLIDELDITDETIVILAGDNGPEETLPWRGTPGFWEGSYFTGMEGSLRSPCLIRWPGRIPKARESDEIVHITDMFTTLVGWAGGDVPQDRVIDGLDQRDFFEDKKEQSAREGFLFWNGERMYGVKWKDFKISYVHQKNMWDPVLEYAVPHIYNLKIDPKERENVMVYYGWVAQHAAKILYEFQASTKEEPLIPPGAPLDYNPYKIEMNT